MRFVKSKKVQAMDINDDFKKEMSKWLNSFLKAEAGKFIFEINGRKPYLLLSKTFMEGEGGGMNIYNDDIMLIPIKELDTITDEQRKIIESILPPHSFNDCWNKEQVTDNLKYISVGKFKIDDDFEYKDIQRYLDCKLYFDVKIEREKQEEKHRTGWYDSQEEFDSRFDNLGVYEILTIGLELDTPRLFEKVFGNGRYNINNDYNGRYLIKVTK